MNDYLEVCPQCNKQELECGTYGTGEYVVDCLNCGYHKEGDSFQQILSPEPIVGWRDKVKLENG